WYHSWDHRWGTPGSLRVNSTRRAFGRGSGGDRPFHTSPRADGTRGWSDDGGPAFAVGRLANSRRCSEPGESVGSERSGLVEPDHVTRDILPSTVARPVDRAPRGDRYGLPASDMG